MPHSKDRERTELENCVLGIVWLYGPCTAYVVRQEFVTSQSSHWSGSAGSIYPLLERLRNAGLISAAHETWGRGRKTRYRITSSGEATLRAWLGPPLPEWTAAPTFDPVRTRLSFLGALSPRRRREFVSAALENLDRQLVAARARMESIDDPYERLSVLGTIYELDARGNWLREVDLYLARPERTPGRSPHH